jgi:hypothetical protein
VGSPEAASVVERLRAIAEGDPEDYGEIWPSECRVLLTVVEAAQAIENNDDAHGGHSKRHLIVAGDCLSCRLREALAASTTPDSAGEPEA